MLETGAVQGPEAGGGGKGSPSEKQGLACHLQEPLEKVTPAWFSGVPKDDGETQQKLVGFLPPSQKT